MGNKTSVTIVMMGGALATLLLFLAQALWLPEDYALQPGIESSLGVIITSVLAFVLPDNVVQKIRRRTKPPKEGA